MSTHIYQFALRRADEVKKQFVIESDLVFAKKKLTKEEIQHLADRHACAIRLTYLGVLTPSKKEEYIDAEYHTKDMIEKNINSWKENKGEQNDGQSESV